VKGSAVRLAPRVYRITPEAAEELDLWRRRMEAERDGCGWDAPSGFDRDSWPPF